MSDNTTHTSAVENNVKLNEKIKGRIKQLAKVTELHEKPDEKFNETKSDSVLMGFTNVSSLDYITKLFHSTNLENNFVVLIMGIGGGSDALLSCALWRHLEKQLKGIDSNRKVKFFIVNAKNGRPKESDHTRFEDYAPGLYRVKKYDALNVAGKVVRDDSEKTEFNRTLLLESSLSWKYDIDVYVSDVDNPDLLETLSSFKPNLVIAEDTGGDSFAKDPIAGEIHRDQISLALLRKVTNNGENPAFIHMVTGPGCDGETTVEAMNDVLREIADTKVYTVDPIAPLLLTLKEWTNVLRSSKTPSILVQANANFETGKFGKNDNYVFNRYHGKELVMEYGRATEIVCVLENFLPMGQQAHQHSRNFSVSGQEMQ